MNTLRQCKAVHQIQQSFDIYNTYDGMNNLKTVNDNAGKEAVEVDPELIELLLKAKEFYELSDGEFDVTMGDLLNIWHIYREDGIEKNTNGEYGQVPDTEALAEAEKHRGFEYVEIDEENNTVYITDEDVRIDVGGIAKGFATEKVAEALEDAGVEHAAINAGGNNRTLGDKVDGSTWNVGIQNPDGEGSLLVVHRFGSYSFVTSGDYERYYYADEDTKYHHIIDPDTLFPADHFRSVTVITEDSGDADCLSTALFTMDFEEGNRLIEACRNANPNAHLEVIWIMDEDIEADTEYQFTLGGYRIAYTEGLEGEITW